MTWRELNIGMEFVEDYDLQRRAVALDSFLHNGTEYLVLTIDIREEENIFDDRFGFETIVYCEQWHGECRNQYTTLTEAFEGHEIVKKLILTNEFKIKHLKDLMWN